MKNKSFPINRQCDSTDCGAACLQMIAKYYGKHYNLKTLRDYSFISREGSSLMGVSDAAEKIGFHTVGLKIGVEILKQEAPLPCILHWNQNHYVVCYKIKSKKEKTKYYIADPAQEQRVFSEKEFLSHWISTRHKEEERGIALTLQPGTEFYDSEDESKTENKHKLRYFFKYLRPYQWELGQIALAMILFMILGLIFPFLTQSIVDVGIRNNNLGFVVMILIAQFILSYTEMGIGFLQNWISLHINTRINIALISDFWSKLMRLPIKFFDTKNTGDLMQRLGDHGRIENFLVNDSIYIVFTMISFIVYTTLLGYYHMVLLGIFLTGHLLYAGWVLLFLKYRKELDYKSFEIQTKDRNCIIELIQGMPEIKLNNDERQKRWEWERIQAKYFYNNIRGLKLNQIQSFGASILTRTTGLIVSFIVAKSVIDGKMTLGMMMALSYIMGQVSAPISRVIGFIHSFQNAKISLERLNEIHSQEDEDDKRLEFRNDIPAQADLNFKNVFFSYSGSSREYVLKDISFTIPQNKITAIVGMSGSGKTTIMKLLQGFYTPQEGDIKIHNVPLRFINPHFWRGKVGSVMQDGYIFSDSIARNIAIGEDDIDKERLKMAVEMACISEFIDDLPLGFNTKIGMEGNGISQGQRQRILIARAVYKNPDILLFDEATNALDSKNEKAIMENLSEFYKGKTVVISAHRLSTIKNAHQIIVLKDGNVQEQGTHVELMEQRGEYFKLIENQMEVIHE